MIDSHCHLAFDEFDDRVEQVVADANAAGVRGLITVSTTTTDCRTNLAIARRFENVWCSAGVHPLHAHEPRDWDAVREVAADPKCVAWGELGLDNHYSEPPRNLQMKVLEEQLAFLESCRAAGLEKPIILHCRDAFDDLIAVLSGSAFDPGRFVFHCFTGTPDDVRRVLDFGAWVSFTGVVTFRNAPEVAQAAALVPGDRIMVETDAPFLSPEPVRKVWPCEPKFVVHTLGRLANIRGVDPEELERQLDSNTARFFRLPIPASGSSAPAPQRRSSDDDSRT